MVCIHIMICTYISGVLNDVHSYTHGNQDVSRVQFTRPNRAMAGPSARSGTAALEPQPRLGPEHWSLYVFIGLARISRPRHLRRRFAKIEFRFGQLAEFPLCKCAF